jgi:acyl transferase domain-containing protein/NADPH-dependent curcumin reductase CurA/acyl carrier protein
MSEMGEEPIAIVGLACRFPDATDVEAYWRLLCEGRDATREVPADRWNAGMWHDPDPHAPGRMITRHGCFLDDVSGFDPLFFGISPREAAEMDPQQRMILEVVWEALEDAGIPATSLKDSRTGVYMGAIWHDYAARHLVEHAVTTAHSATGQSLNIVANRVSYFLGLRGPSLSVDTACSSSLVAVHLACQSLRSGESRLALVGGVNLMFSPETSVLLSRFGGLAPDGRSKAFAAGADGFGRGEGAGVVVLQPLSAAIASGAHIYCVIRGSVVNNNGTGNGLVAPSVPAQAALLRDAYAKAGVAPGRVHYVETHGTGTALGDPTEASALGAALGEGRPADRPLLIGSVKPNIGHLEGAAGIAGLLKLALAIDRRLMPPHLLLGEPNPRIPFEELRLSLPRKLEPWPCEGETAIAGVSGFGWGGTNCHVVVEEAPVGRGDLLPLAAEDEAELRAQVQRMEELALREESPVSLRDMCRTWATRVGGGRYRAAFTVNTRAELAVQVKAFQQGRRRAGLSVGEAGEQPPRVVFLCSPQGAQWPAMGRELLATEPVFRARLMAMDATFMPLAGWSLVEALREPNNRVTSDEDAVHPLVLAVQVGLAALWRSWGVEPEVVVGHGVGDVAAACLAGVVEAGDAAWLVYRASRLDQWEALRDELEATQARMRPQARRAKWILTLVREAREGRPVEASARSRNTRQVARFNQAVEQLVEEGFDTFLELGPHPVLCRPVEQALRKAGRQGLVVGSLRREDARGGLLDALGALHTRGVQVRWEVMPPPRSPVEEVPVGRRPEVAGRSELLPLSAQSHEALADSARALLSHLETSPHTLHDVSYTAAVHRAHLPHRLALVARSLSDVREGLSAYLRNEPFPGLAATHRADGWRPPVVFVFPGQGSQWVGMGRKLLGQEPAFRVALEACDAALRRFVDWSLLDLIGSDDAGWMERIDKVQPAIFSLQVALARLWRSWGVVPDVVVGHSMGEVAAAHVAGALTLEDAARIICRRSQLLRRLSGQGGMAMVELTLAEAREALRGLEDKLSVAASNSPRATVLSGEPQALSEVLERLEARHVFCRRVKVDVASHSPQMDPLREELLEALEALTPRRGEVPLYSTVTAALTDGADLDGTYWVRNLREPVLLAPVVEQLANSGHSLFLEVSPHPILLPSVEQTLAHLRLEGVVLPSLRREQAERDAMLETLGCLYSVGWEVQWPSLYPEGGRMLRLPDYPWQHQSYWFQPGAAGSVQTASTGRGHSLGAPRRSSLRPGAFLWDVELGPERMPYLKDHKVQGNAVLPATAYLDWGLAAAEEALGFGAWTLEGVRLSEVLVVPREGSRVAELVLAPGSSEGGLSFRVSSFIPSPGSAGSGVWTTHMTGNVRALGPTEAALSFVVSLEEVQRRCSEMLLGDVHYWEMEKRGLQYGPAFRGLQELWRREGEALGRISMPQVLGSVRGLHPAILDACLQVLLEAVPPGDGTFLPIQVRRYTVLRSDAEPRWAYARLTKQEPAREGATIEGDVLFFDSKGDVIGEVQGVTMKMLPSRMDPVRAEQDRVLFELTWRKMALPAPRGGIAGAPWLVLMDKGGQGEALVAALEARGESCIRVEAGKELRRPGPGHYVVEPGTREHLRAVLSESFPEGKPCSGVVFLWGLDLPASDVPGAVALDEVVKACGSALRVVQEVVTLGWRDLPRTWVVTRGAWPVEGAAVTGALQASLWGLARSVGNEHPELRCTCVDLDPEAPLKDAEALGSELAANVDDEQVALRAGGRYGARLVRRVVSPELRGGEEPMMPAAGRPFRVETLSQSMLGVVLPRAAERRRPGPGEVEIAVESSSLNFIDVMKAMGIYPGMPPGPAVLGLDCAGRISAVGPGVTGLSVGQAVVAFAPDSLASHVVTDARFAVPLPSSVDMLEAGSLPSVFMTAWYALHHLGRLQRGERVLIHSAAGGLGLAAVQIAQALGAEVFATAGTPEKREMLRGLGIQHVMDSRTLAFGDEVMRLTQGEGVDVVLNSLSGDAISRSLEVLAQDGRFLEVGKRDIYEGRALDLSLFRRRLSYMAIDLVGLRERRPALCAQLLREVVEQVGAGVLRPLPCRRFPISQVGEAIRTMAQGQHVGKLVISMDDPELRLAPSRQGFRVRPDASYLITGGLGGLGLSAAKWLVEQGARCLLLMGRSEVPEATKPVLQSLRDAGARVEVVRADVADAKRLAEVVARTHGELPQLRGVLHCAGLLDDGILEHQDPERFRKVMQPKVHGAWNLHAVTREESLDFFVLYSSMAALLGTPGQSNYAAANTAIDALAHYRRQQGLPALSINWGPFSEVGLAAAHANRGERLAFRGMGSFSPRQGEALLERLLSEAAVNVAAVPLDVRQWLEFFPSAATLRVWDELSGEQAGDSPRVSRSGVLAELRQAAPGARLNLLESHLRERLAQVLRIEPSRVGRHEPFRALGLDSLLSLELRNRIEVALELKLSAALLWAHSTLAALATHLLEQVGLAPGNEAPASQPQLPAAVEPQQNAVQRPAETEVEQLASLSEEKLLELMDDALASLEDAS